MKVKVCGMREPENIRKVAALGPDFMGFIFYEKSKRFAGNSITPELLASLSPSVQKVGVFVNETSEFIGQKVRAFGLDLVQLHGTESPRQCQELKDAGIKVIKAFSVGDSFSFQSTLLYERSCEYFLFDTKGKSYGGNGVVFDWELLKGNLSDKPFFLSGGLNLGNLAGEEFEALRPKPFALDVNSGFEQEPGLKKVEELERLIEGIKGKR
ncbi:phosphoribosylanthranilate isomerase [Pontibacter ummariensis]|uniref:N-(5'-phosphoribosyl)anthranilate isomerase n=1 Tax=Pontibacter ummariensis TaxID=1610492 RepID=A0A239BXE9_9BACT|nr:phosphoribosylanthranilate isomerase [Pontibacter ummariensis]PRY15575.1 phosphoribosylanthranilate isomerase [Pontibacter ummariensis]SNS12332.1 phosphoribosylanthranilate isomerase [Pontibacter ummariensis]